MVRDRIVVVVGAGGMGEAIARRQGVGCRLLLADVNLSAAKALAGRLTLDGYDVATAAVDVANRASIRELADNAATAGTVLQLVHTAGLSPEQASAETIVRVDLYGVAAVLTEFREVIAPYGAGVVIASMAGHLAQLSDEQEAQLASTDVDDLLDLPFLQPDSLVDPATAYMVAKRANMLRVAAEGLRWGKRRARLNSISPGVILTAMGREELEGASGAGMRQLIAAASSGRVGTGADIADAAAFLLGPHASFITGADLLVDGGALGVIRAASIVASTEG